VPAPSVVVVVVMGVAGSGKSTVAALLADRLGWDFVDGDDLHPLTNISKMRQGTPLDDSDRAPWLDRLNAEIRRRVTAADPAAIACSALKRSYRARLRQGADPRRVAFVHLEVDRATLEQRLQARTDHYMPATLLDSQLATLEPPAATEPDAITVDGAQSLSQTIDDLARRFSS
jgi:gluconokinase